MWDFLKLGSCACVFAVSACGTGNRGLSESEGLGQRRSALELVVSAEIGTDKPALTPTDLGHNPVIASDGSGFLAVQEVDSRIRAVRVDATGKVLDATWLDLGEPSEPQYYPSVAFGGGHYLVTWSALDAQSRVRGRFVRPDGSLEGTAAFTLSGGQGLYSSVGWTGSQFLVSWLGLNGSDNSVTVAAFDSSGAKIASSEHVISSPGSLAYPRIAVGTRRALVTWEKYTHDDLTGDVGRIQGTLVDLSGASAGAGEFALSNSASSETTASVATSGSHFLVVWQTQDDPSSVFGSSIDDNGTFDREDATFSHSTEAAGLPSVAFDGSRYLVAWADGRDAQSIYGTPVSTTGAVLGAEDVKLASGSPRYVAFSSDRTALAWSGSKYLLSFLGNGIEGSLIAADLKVVNGQIPLTAVPSSQGYPSLVWNGVDYVVQWTDERVSSTDMSVRAVRIDPSGHVLDSDGIVLSTPEAPAFGASLASSGNSSSLSLWSGGDGSSYRRTLAASGTLGSVSPFGTTPLFSPPAVAGNGNGYLAVYMTGDSSDGAVFARVLDASGSFSTDIRIDSSTVNTGPNVFAAAGSGYLVSYAKAGTHLISVSPAGLLGPSIELSSNISFVNVATGANKTLVTWTDTSDTKIRASFFASDALVGEPLVLAESSAGYSAALSWDGSSYFGIWETPEHHLEGRSVAQDGTLGPVSTLVDEECYGPVSASNKQGQVLVSYIKYGSNFRSRRVASRLIGAAIGAGGGDSGGGGGSPSSAGNAGMASGFAGSGGLPSSAGGGGTASSTAGSGGSVAMAGSGTAGAATAGAPSMAGAGGGTLPPPVLKCSVANVGAGQASSHGGLGIASLLAAIAGIMTRRQRRAREA